MTLERQILVWAVALAALGYLLYLLGGAVAPFAAGIALGYLLDPVVRRMQGFGLSRLVASLIILVVFILVGALLLLIAAPALANQFASFAQKLPGYAMRLQALAVDQGTALFERYGGEWRASGWTISADQIQKSVGDFVAPGRAMAAQLPAFAGFRRRGDLQLPVVPRSSRRSSPSTFWSTGTRWSRPSTAGCRCRIATRCGRSPARSTHALAGFIRGQSLVCLFLGLWYGIGLTLIGLDFGFLIGVIAGVLSFIPYVGSLTALVLSVGVGLVQGWPSLTLFLSALGDRAGRPVPRGLRHIAQAGRRIDRAAPGLADVRLVRLRRAVRLHRPVDRRAGGGGARRPRPPPHRPLSQQPALSRRRRVADGGTP